ncbi:MAG: TlyA family RNA methyltransferase [Deferribacterales bacterium]
MASPKKERIDSLLVSLELVGDIDEARRFIMAGLVVADDHRVDKAGDMVSSDAVIRLKSHNKYASRGGLKLEKAVSEFHINFQNKTVIDIGASTGGFTDVALTNGASRVFAVDTGRGQLDPRLSRDERVTVLDNTNFRTVDFSVIGSHSDIFVCDVSFISLKMIIPACRQFARDGSEAVFLIKPQFEAMKQEVGRGGIVTDRSVHERVIREVIGYGGESGFSLRGLCMSPIKGAKGNIEYLVYFVYNDVVFDDKIENIISRVVNEEYSYSCQAPR